MTSADWKYYSSPSHTGADSGYEDSVHANSSSSSSKKSRAVLDHTFFEEEVDDASANNQIPEEISVAKKSDWSERWAGVQLEGVIQQLRGVIADIQGRYAELETFEHSVNALYRLLKVIINKLIFRNLFLKIFIYKLDPAARSRNGWKSIQE